MNQIAQINKQIKQLENRADLLRKELKIIRDNCHHEFKSDSFMKTCVKCGFVDVLYY